MARDLLRMETLCLSSCGSLHPPPSAGAHSSSIFSTWHTCTLTAHCQNFSIDFVKIKHVVLLITSYARIVSSGWRSSFHDWAPRQKRRSVFQHQWQTWNYFQPGQRPSIRSDLDSICFIHGIGVDFWGLFVFLQVFWSMARLLETRKYPLMVSLTPTFTDLVSPTHLWGWGWRWIQRSSQCTRVGKKSSCCGLHHRLWKDPSKCHGIIHFSQSIPLLHHYKI